MTRASEEKVRLIEVLENRAKDPRVVQVRERYLDAMQLPAAASVLDIGCGSGVVARSLAKRTGFDGSIVGLDEDEELLEAARKLAADEGVAQRIDFRVGDAHRLDFADESLDGVTAQTAISHMHDPPAVLSEVCRVLKPGCSLAIFDGDYESRAFSCSDHQLARKVESAWRALSGHLPRLMRDMPRLLDKTGFDVVEVIPFVEFQIGDEGSWLDTAERFAPRMVEGGSLSSDEAEQWLRELKEDARRGTFFTASNYYAFVARRR